MSDGSGVRQLAATNQKLTVLWSLLQRDTGRSVLWLKYEMALLNIPMTDEDMLHMLAFLRQAGLVEERDGKWFRRD